MLNFQLAYMVSRQCSNSFWAEHLRATVVMHIFQDTRRGYTQARTLVTCSSLIRTQLKENLLQRVVNDDSGRL